MYTVVNTYAAKCMVGSDYTDIKIFKTIIFFFLLINPWQHRPLIVVGLVQ